MSDENLLQTAEKLARAATHPVVNDEMAPFVVVPANYKLESLEHLADQPRLRRAAPKFTTLDSFLRYVADFKTDGTRIFADPAALTIRAVFDYHEPGDDGSRWCVHSCLFSPRLSEQWKVWTAIDRQSVPQKQFANFIEDNAPDISTPPAAEMLDIASTLQATMNVNFRKGVRLDNSTEQLTYEETIEARAGRKGDLTVPTQILLFIPIFEGELPRSIDVRLRYAIAEGKLSFTCVLSRRSDLLAAQWKQIVDAVAAGTSLAPFMGAM